jgi:hypothetical protein
VTGRATSNRVREIISELRQLDDADPALSPTMYAAGWNAALAALMARIEDLDE